MKIVFLKATVRCKCLLPILDKDAIVKARTGIYSAKIRADVSPERLRRFFVKIESGDYLIKKEIREMVIFAPQNLVMHPPFTRLDIVTCRNLLIYLDTELQKKLMPLFHYSLNPGGMLLLGSAETVGTATDLFRPLAAKVRLFQRLGTSQKTNLVDFPSSFARIRLDARSNSINSSEEARPTPTLQSVADQILLQRYSPAAVMVTGEGDILYVSGKTGKYLEPAASKANWNLFAMARDGFGSALSEAFHEAIRQKFIVELKDVEIKANGGKQVIDVTVQPITIPEALSGMVMVVFTDVAKASTTSRPVSPRSKKQDVRYSAMAQELQKAHQELNASRDEMQISQEELKSTNEELQSMNEELQSTNEELTMSKEEMQSMNEELQTVNHELQAKVDELSRTSDDMKNLLYSTDIATLFLDEALLVRRFTTQAAQIIKLIPSDVGRPITDIVTDLDYPKLVQDIRGVLKKKSFVENQIATRDRRWFTVRIMPYRTQQNHIDGVVITFADITVAKTLEAELRKAQPHLKNRSTK